MSPTLRALRVGVLLGDKLVEERVFRSEHLAPITFGQSLRCTLSVPADGVPANHVLFGVDQGRLVLRVTAQMSGRLAQRNQVDSELRQGPGDNGIWTIPLERGARGKLHAGNATILFQDIAAPPIAPRPQLPASVRGSLVDRVDRRLAVIVAGSLMFHLGIAGWAWMQDREKVAGSEGDVAQYDAPKYDVIDVTAPDEPLPVTSGEPGVAAPVKPAMQTPTNSWKTCLRLTCCVEPMRCDSAMKVANP